MASSARIAVIAAGMVGGIVVIAAAGWFWYWHTVDTNPSGGHNSYGMRDYTPEEQKKAAESLVAGLNTHDLDKVELLRFRNYPHQEIAEKAIDENIVAALPPPDCRYVLDGVEDKGEQDPAAAPWYQPEHAWGFDMKLQQRCPGQQPTPRTIRVIAIPSGMGGYWAEAAFKEEP
ncbi:hypothetical protein [Mycolicibacterium palauense]|uniref:hypothetical protein n=1 Tax=Mycolicibacterium palauense TaxID=2034511 RepID=UPI001145EE08|nr:hypothetical protein [Mycolicibacterium palauense]